MRKQTCFSYVTRIMMSSPSVGAVTLLLSFAFLQNAPASAEESACPDPQTEVCDVFVPGSTVTGACEGRECFERIFAEEAAIKTADDNSLFPTIWFIKSKVKGNIVDTSGLLYPCQVKVQGKKKWRIDILETHCAVTYATQTPHLFVEFFASNPVSGCLGWVECQVN